MFFILRFYCWWVTPSYAEMCARIFALRVSRVMTTIAIANNAVLGKTLNKKSLSDIIIILPDLKKQIEISKKIKQIDTILLNLKNTEKEFENLSESLFYKYID